MSFHILGKLIHVCFKHNYLITGFSPNNIGSYMKVLNTNYKPVTIEFKILFNFLDIVIYVKSF